MAGHLEASRMMNGRRVDLHTADGTMDVYVFRPDGDAGPWPSVVFYMDAFGIRPELGDMAGRLALAGYVVVLPNLYYRTPFAPFDPTLVAAGGAERDRFKRMIATIGGPQVMADTAAVLLFLESETHVRQGAAAALGYCMGGGYALRAAAAFPDRFAVAASFHGGSLATDNPDSPHLLASRITAQVYIGVAEIDPSFPPEQQSRLERTLVDAGVPHTIEVYPGARHGFAVTGHHVFDAGASERHWVRLLELLSEHV
jgi:carboxymethylenebutenolidase